MLCMSQDPEPIEYNPDELVRQEEAISYLEKLVPQACGWDQMTLQFNICDGKRKLNRIRERKATNP